MNWTRTNDVTPTWISGIYKIVHHKSGFQMPDRYYAYYIPYFASNWGDYVGTPPVRDNFKGHWETFESAEVSCKEHSVSHETSRKTIKRAEELLIEQTSV